MPLYEYACPTHGLFDLFRPAAEYLAPGACPTCGASAPRVMSAPNLRTLSPLKRSAHERNEKSRHEPHLCSSRCGHPHPPKAAARAAAAGKVQAYTGPRPWVVEHA